MRAGKLRYRVRIEEAADTRDAGGGFTRVWQLLDVVSADIESEGAGEPLDAAAPTATVNHTATLRYRTGVTPAMRLKIVGTDRVLRILTSVDPDGRRRELVLTCIEKVEDEAA